jgi:hypothetical protein
VIFNQLPQRLRRLVIGGVGFKDQRVIVFNHGAKRFGLLRLIVDNMRVIEFDARLDHQADDAWPDVGQPA